MRRSASLTLLNALSLTRLPLAGLFLLSNTVPERVGLIAGAAATDFLDGWLARRKNLASRVGALIDPVADRAFVVTALVTYLLEAALTPWQFFLVLLRDLSTALGFVIARIVPAFRQVEFKARPPGKVVTGAQLIVLLAVPLWPSAIEPMVLSVGVVSVYAVVDYALAVWRARAR
ncbi:MAG: CDP-alcohol phosphatidyltransferase family protein [Myxococcaceae bacterium]|nr:CDP-alcohol phosphatidyltransferase family protein [Myxococcaceae bacterium]MCI0673599.1 CDP-alcohol phosphatidyltransferase family protein [Myxococcaceae bacterium]